MALAAAARNSILKATPSMLVALSVVACLAILLFMPSKALAQAVTYTQTDINNGSTGSFTYNGGVTPPLYTIAGSGTGVTFFDDSFSFVGTPAAGAITLQGKVVSQTNTGDGALAGFCIRNSVQQQYAYSYVLAVTPANGIVFYRRYQGGGNSLIATASGTASLYLKLARDGTPSTGFTVNAYYGSDGINWTLLASAAEANTNPMPNKFYAGFVVSSSVMGSTQSTAVFDHFLYMVSVPQPSSQMLLWLRSDMSVSTSGGANVDSWGDQSGNSMNGTNTGSARPTLTSGAANSGILSAVTLDGSSQYLNLPSGFSNLSAGASLFAMLRPASSSATGVPFVCGNSGPADALLARTVGTNAELQAYSSTTASSVATSSNPLSTTAFRLYEATFTPGVSNGTGRIWVGGNSEAIATNMVASLSNTSRSSNFVGVNIGSTEHFAGDLCELIVMANPVSDSQRHSLEAYFLSKYGVGATPQLDAPVAVPQSGTFLPQQAVILSQPQNAVVHYRTDGITPTAGDLWFFNNQSFFLTSVSPEYVPRVKQTSTIQAIAKAPFFSDSPVTTATLTTDTTTAAIPRSGLVQWLRASDVTTSGSNVTTWQDVSGTGNSGTNATNQPTLVTSAVNGLPAVNFSGSQFLQMPAGMSNFTSGMTAMLVAKPVSATSGSRLFDFANGATSDNIILSLPSTTGLTFSTYNGSTASSVTASSGVNLGQFQLLEAVYNGTNTGTLLANSVQLAQSTSMQTLNNLTRNNNFLAQDSVGGNRFNGQIAELLIWNRQLSVTERTAVEGYLLGKYQLLSSNAVAAPILSVPTSTLAAPAQVAIAGPHGAKIYWTNDGSTPTSSSNAYLGPVRVNWTQTLKAIAVLNGISSSVASSTLTLDSTKWAAPVSSDTRTLNLEQQLPTVGIPHDANQP